MTRKRPSIPAELEHDVLLSAAFACSVCHESRRGVQVHHIDGDRTNNTRANLITLCLHHHDLAHTQKGLTKTLSPSLLREAKARWEKSVRDNGLARMAATTSPGLSRPEWSYFHFARLLHAAKDAGINLESVPAMVSARDSGILDSGWFPRDNPDKPTSLTVYETFSFRQAHLLFAAFEALVDAVIQASPPAFTAWAWRKALLQSLANQQSLCFSVRAFSFTKAAEHGIRECRNARYTKDGIQLAFQFDTWFAHGVSAVGVHFKGRSRIGALLRLRSAEMNTVKGKKVLCVNASPLALGTGFIPEVEKPAIAYIAEMERDSNR